MKRLIVRRQVIDCGETTCGKCQQRSVYWCKFFDVALDHMTHRGRELYLRDYQCKNAERTADEQPSGKGVG